MPLRIHRDQPVIRICGCLLGIGFVLVGAFSILGADTLGTEIGHRQATGFGFTAIFIGIVALLCSMLVKDLSNIWCQHPRRWK